MIERRIKTAIQSEVKSMKNKIPLLLLMVIAVLLLPLLYNLYLKNDGEMKISDVLVTKDETNVLVYARVSHFSEDIENAILAGVPTTFTFRIEFYQSRKFWFDKRLAYAELKKSIKYDQIRSTFYLTADAQKPAEGFQKFEKARRALTELNGIPIIGLNRLQKNQSYYARVKLEWDNYRLPLYAEVTRIILSLRDFETGWACQPFDFQK